MYHNAENFGKETLLCLFFRKIPVAIKVMDKRGRRVSSSSVESFLSQSAKNFGSGKHLCCVSEKFRWQKTLWITEELSSFSVEMFL